MSPELQILRHLSVTEKLRVVEELWDEIAAPGEPIPLPAWHRAEAERRAADLAADPSIALTREEMWRRVDSPNG